MTGSLVNQLISSGSQPAPKVGDGATKCGYSDRSPATIIEVNATGNSVIVQMDDYKRTDSNGMSDDQEYSYTQNKDNPTAEYTKRKNGSWVAKNQSMKSGQRLSIGHRERHFDFTL